MVESFKQAVISYETNFSIFNVISCKCLFCIGSLIFTLDDIFSSLLFIHKLYVIYSPCYLFFLYLIPSVPYGSCELSYSYSALSIDLVFSISFEILSFHKTRQVGSSIVLFLIIIILMLISMSHFTINFQNIFLMLTLPFANMTWLSSNIILSVLIPYSFKFELKPNGFTGTNFHMKQRSAFIILAFLSQYYYICHNLFIDTGAISQMLFGITKFTITYTSM